ncbi:MAG: DNA gyrase inhibitor YacG [Planctomycetota bacterium]
MASTVPCPTCGQPVLLGGDAAPPSRPFCSERCRRLDLGAWVDERYRVAAAGDDRTSDDDQGESHGEEPR